MNGKYLIYDIDIRYKYTDERIITFYSGFEFLVFFTHFVDQSLIVGWVEHRVTHQNILLAECPRFHGCVRWVSLRSTHPTNAVKGYWR